ncbi:hypothetical protein [Pararhizobium sp.]|uniref:hypothetical protein n=1 Tax=Pararhizobium sp. TaxID=1977563 RepID=UPI003D10206F
MKTIAGILQRLLADVGPDLSRQAVRHPVATQKPLGSGQPCWLTSWPTALRLREIEGKNHVLETLEMSKTNGLPKDDEKPILMRISRFADSNIQST